MTLEILLPKNVSTDIKMKLTIISHLRELTRLTNLYITLPISGTTCAYICHSTKKEKWSLSLKKSKPFAIKKKWKALKNPSTVELRALWATES